ncbi:hypothetical protein CDIK_0548 [Cucumispora dikerogammari]|nr:hypothetical protein CDIK_0548 [Cucumispora dikerogammari]
MTIIPKTAFSYFNKPLNENSWQQIYESLIEINKIIFNYKNTTDFSIIFDILNEINLYDDFLIKCLSSERSKLSGATVELLISVCGLFNKISLGTAGEFSYSSNTVDTTVTQNTTNKTQRINFIQAFDKYLKTSLYVCSKVNRVLQTRGEQLFLTFAENSVLFNRNHRFIIETLIASKSKIQRLSIFRGVSQYVSIYLKNNNVLMNKVINEFFNIIESGVKDSSPDIRKICREFVNKHGVVCAEEKAHINEAIYTKKTSFVSKRDTDISTDKNIIKAKNLTNHNNTESITDKKKTIGTQGCLYNSKYDKNTPGSLPSERLYARPTIKSSKPRTTEQDLQSNLDGVSDKVQRKNIKIYDKEIVKPSNIDSSTDRIYKTLEDSVKLYRNSPMKKIGRLNTNLNKTEDEIFTPKSLKTFLTKYRSDYTTVDNENSNNNLLNKSNSTLNSVNKAKLSHEIGKLIVEKNIQNKLNKKGVDLESLKSVMHNVPSTNDLLNYETVSNELINYSQADFNVTQTDFNITQTHPNVIQTQPSLTPTHLDDTSGVPNEVVAGLELAPIVQQQTSDGANHNITDFNENTTCFNQTLLDGYQGFSDFNQSPTNLNATPTDLYAAPVRYEKTPSGFNKESTDIHHKPLGFNQNTSGIDQTTPDFNHPLAEFNLQTVEPVKTETDLMQSSVENNIIQRNFNLSEAVPNQPDTGFNQALLDFNSSPEVLNCPSRVFNVSEAVINHPLAEVIQHDTDPNQQATKLDHSHSYINQNTSGLNQSLADFNQSTTEHKQPLTDFNHITTNFNQSSINLNQSTTDFNKLTPEINQNITDCNQTTSTSNQLSKVSDYRPSTGFDLNPANSDIKGNISNYESNSTNILHNDNNISSNNEEPSRQNTLNSDLLDFDNGELYIETTNLTTLNTQSEINNSNFNNFEDNLNFSNAGDDNVVNGYQESHELYIKKEKDLLKLSYYSTSENTKSADPNIEAIDMDYDKPVLSGRAVCLKNEKFDLNTAGMELTTQQENVERTISNEITKNTRLSVESTGYKTNVIKTSHLGDITEDQQGVIYETEAFETSNLNASQYTFNATNAHSLNIRVQKEDGQLHSRVINSTDAYEDIEIANTLNNTVPIVQLESSSIVRQLPNSQDTIFEPEIIHSDSDTESELDKLVSLADEEKIKSDYQNDDIREQNFILDEENLLIDDNKISENAKENLSNAKFQNDVSFDEFNIDDFQNILQGNIENNLHETNTERKLECQAEAASTKSNIAGSLAEIKESAGLITKLDDDTLTKKKTEVQKEEFNTKIPVPSNSKGSSLKASNETPKKSSNNTTGKRKPLNMFVRKQKVKKTTKTSPASHDISRILLKDNELESSQTEIKQKNNLLKNRKDDTLTELDKSLLELSVEVIKKKDVYDKKKKK